MPIYDESTIKAYVVTISKDPNMVTQSHVQNEGFNTRTFVDKSNALEFIKEAQSDARKHGNGAFGTHEMLKNGTGMPPIGYLAEVEVLPGTLQNLTLTNRNLQAVNPKITEIYFGRDAVNPALVIDGNTSVEERKQIVAERLTALAEKTKLVMPNQPSLYVDKVQLPNSSKEINPLFLVRKVHSLDANDIAHHDAKHARYFTSIEAAMEYACKRTDDVSMLPDAITDATLKANGVTPEVYANAEHHLSTTFDVPCTITPFIPLGHTYGNNYPVTSPDTFSFIPLDKPVVVLKAMGTDDMTIVTPGQCNMEEYRQKVADQMKDFSQQVQYTLDCRGNEYMNQVHVRAGEPTLKEPANAVKPEDSKVLANRWAAHLAESGYVMSAIDFRTRYDAYSAHMEGRPALYQALSETFKEVESQAHAKGDVIMEEASRNIVNFSNNMSMEVEAEHEEVSVTEDIDEVEIDD